MKGCHKSGGLDARSHATSGLLTPRWQKPHKQQFQMLFFKQRRRVKLDWTVKKSKNWENNILFFFSFFFFSFIVVSQICQTLK